jgi:hypothetical protein
MLGDPAVQQIAECCTLLRSLELVSHEGLGNPSFAAVGQHCKNLSSFKVLDSFSERLDSQGVAALAGLTKLKTLHLSCIKAEIDPAFQPISQQCTGLTSLSITDCRNFSRWALRRLAFHCKQLVKLDVSRCKKLALYEALVDLQLCTNLEVSTSAGSQMVCFLSNQSSSALVSGY